MQVKQLLDELEKRCTILASSNEATIDPVDHVLLWDVLFQVADHDDGNFQLIQTVLGLYREKIPNFNEDNDIIKSKTSVYLDSSKSFEERTVNSSAILQLIPFFNLPLAEKIVLATIDIINSQFKALNDIPVEFLDPLSECDIEIIAEEDTAPFIEFLQKEIDNPEHRLAAILFFSPLSHGLSHLSPEAGPYAVKTLLDLFSKDDRNSKIVGCYMLAFLAHLFEHDPDTAPEDDKILAILRPLLSDKDQIIRKRSNKAFRLLLDSNFLLTEKSVNEYLSYFPTFPSEYYPEYFKILSTFVVPHSEEDEDDDYMDEEDHKDDEVSLEIIQPIVDFVNTNISSEDPIVRAFCLDVMSDLGFKDFVYIEDDVAKGLEVAQALLDAKQVNTYIYITNFIEILAEKDESSKSKVEPMVKTIVEQLLIENNETLGNRKQVIDCAAMVGQMIKFGSAVDQSDNIAKFVISQLNTNPPEKIIARLCNPIHFIVKTINEENALEIFKHLSESFKVCEDQDNTDDVALCLEKIIKNHSVPEESVRPLVDDSINGKLKILKNTSPHKIFPPCIPPFMIITAYIKKYPTQGSSLIPTLLEWFDESQIKIIPPTLIPINAAFDAGCFNDETAGKFAVSLKDKILKCETLDGHEIGALCDSANRLFNLFPAKMAPISDYLQPLIKFAAKSLPPLEEEEEDDIEELPGQEGLSDITNFVFNVYATDDSVEVINELIAPLLMLLPFEPGCEGINEILTNLAEMFEDKERFSDVLVPGLRMITEILLMKKSELEEYEIDDEAMSALKQTLKKCCKGDRALTQQLTKSFGKSRAKINRFNALIR